MAKRDYYEVLGIAKTASEKEIRQAYRRLARKLHPDVNPGNKASETKFKEVNEAYEVLSDPESRKKYDQYGENWKYADRFAQAGVGGTGGFGGPAGHGGPFEWHWGQQGTPGQAGYGTGGPEDSSDIFEEIFGGGGGFGRRRAGRRGAPAAMPGQDIEQPVDVTLEEAFHGTTRILQMTDASGRPRRIEVKVPPGVKTGSRVRIAGEGTPGFGGGARGDLWLVITVLDHPVFKREGNDLHVEIPVPLVDAMLGGEAQVPTVTGGKLALKIPPETQNGKVFRLSGQGTPRLGGTGRGDLYAKVKVVLPAPLTTRERELFQELRALRGQR